GWGQGGAVRGSPQSAESYLKKALAPGSPYTASETAGRARFLRRAASTVGARPANEVDALLARIADASNAKDDWWRVAVADGLSRGAQERGALAASPRGHATLVDLAFDRQTGVRRAALQMLAATKPTERPRTAATVRRAETLAADADAPADRRADAIGLLAVLDPTPHADLFRKCVDPRIPDEVQAAAVQALGKISSD